MKEFFKYALATVCGIIALGIVAGIIMMISFAGIVASGNATTEIKENSVLVFKLNGTVNERTEEGTPFDALLGTADMSSMGLDDILAAIKKAKNNEDIKGIYIEGGATVFDSPATAQQVRDALHGGEPHQHLHLSGYLQLICPDSRYESERRAYHDAYRVLHRHPVHLFGQSV